MLTIEEQDILVGSRFLLAHLVMQRTRQFYNGAAPSKGMPKEFSRGNFHNIPNHRWQKIALEEIRLKKLKWEKREVKIPVIPTLEENPIVFGE
jgi:DNA-directed RNA polymerase subunit K/omega